MRLKIDRSQKVYEVSPNGLEGREFTDRLRRRIRVGELVRWGGVVRERIDARTYRKPFSFFYEQPSLFDEET